MSDKLDQIKAATAAVKSLGLPPGLRSAAVILCAEDSARGNSMRNLITVNHEAPDFKGLVEDFLNLGGTGSNVNVLDYLKTAYLLTFQEVRSGESMTGRLPSDLRADGRPMQSTGDGSDPANELGRQLPLTGCGPAANAALMLMTRILLPLLGEANEIARSVALISIVGSPGTGKTTLLLALSQLVCEELTQRRSRSLQLMISAVGITQAQAETMADLILDSLDSKHALLVWTRLELQATQERDEVTYGANFTLAARMLFGALTYLDNLADKPSPIGTYSDFLLKMDDTVKAKLLVGDVQQFLCSAAGKSDNQKCVIMWMIDEANTVLHVKGSPSWLQTMVKSHIQHLAQQEVPPASMTVMVLGSSRNSDANMAITLGSPHAKTGVLPIAAMMREDRLAFLRKVTSRLSLAKVPHPSDAELEDETSVLETLLQYIGPNWRCLEWLMTILGGGSPETRSKSKWTAEKLGQMLQSLGKAHSDNVASLQGVQCVSAVLTKLHDAAVGASWIQHLTSNVDDIGVKDQATLQAVAYSLLMEPVKLVSRVPGTEWTWAELVASGMAHAVFLDSHDALTSSPVNTPTLSPTSSLQLEITEKDIVESSGLNLATGSNVQPRVQVQPRIRVQTLLGTLPISHTGNDPALLPVIIQMAPVVVVILYHQLKGFEFTKGSILGDIVCRESALRKECTDIAVLVMRLHLYRNILQRNTVSLPSLLRGAWLAPPLRQLRVELPDTEHQVLKMMRINHMNEWEDMGASPSSDLTNFEEISQRACAEASLLPAFAYIGPGNRGSDSLLFVRLLGAAKLTPIFLQSKSSAKGSTVTYMEIYQAAEDNLTTHQVSFGNFSNAEVPGLEDMPSEDASAAKVSRHGLRQSPRTKIWPGGALQEFRKLIFSKSCPSEQCLESWEQSLVHRPAASAHVQADLDYLFLYSTDHRVTSLQSLKQRILAAAGDTLAVRTIVVSKEEQRAYHGYCMMMQREVSHIVGAQP